MNVSLAVTDQQPTRPVAGHWAQKKTLYRQAIPAIPASPSISFKILPQPAPERCFRYEKIVWPPPTVRYRELLQCTCERRTHPALPVGFRARTRPRNLNLLRKNQTLLEWIRECVRFVFFYSFTFLLLTPFDRAFSEWPFTSSILNRDARLILIRIALSRFHTFGINDSVGVTMTYGRKSHRIATAKNLASSTLTWHSIFQFRTQNYVALQTHSIFQTTSTYLQHLFYQILSHAILCKLLSGCYLSR